MTNRAERTAPKRPFRFIGLIQTAGVDDGLSVVVAAQHHQQVGHHGGLALLVQIYQIALVQALEGHFHHAHGAVHDHLAGVDDGRGLLTLQHDGCDLGGVGQIGDAGFDDLQTGLGHLGLDLVTDAAGHHFTGAAQRAVVGVTVTGGVHVGSHVIRIDTFFFLPSLFGLTLKDLIVRAFYSHRDTKTPVKVTVLQMIIQVVFSLILSQIIGIRGLALSTSLSSIISGFLMLFLYRKKYGRINLKQFSMSITKITVASVIMGVFTHLVYSGLADVNYILALIASIGISILIYLILIILFKIPEVRSAINIAYHKLKKHRKK